MNLVVDHPWRLLWLLALLPMLWLGFSHLRTLDPVRRATALLLRAGVWVLLVLMVAGLQWVQDHDQQTVVAIVDHSESVQRHAAETIAPRGPLEQMLQHLGKDMQAEDGFVYMTYDGQSHIQNRTVGHMVLDQGLQTNPRPGTDTAQAIEQAIAAKANPNSRLRLVLATDGNDTTGDTLQAIEQAKAAGVAVDLVPIRYRRQNEVMVQRLDARLEAAEGQSVRIAAQLRATAPTDGQFEFSHNDQRVGQPIAITKSQWAPERGRPTQAGGSNAATQNQTESQPDRWVCQVAMDVPLGMGSAGRHQFQGVFTPANSQADGLAANNQARAVTLVHGQGQILVVDNEGGRAGQVLDKKLTEHGMVVQTIRPEQLASSLGQLHAYDAIVLQNVPADAVTPTQQQALSDYVQQLGGGLVMLGGPKSFAAGAWTNTPIDRILPVQCEIPSQTVLPSGALVLVIDRSGSMGSLSDPNSKQRMANESAILALRTLYEDDMVAVLAFDSSYQEIVPLQRNTNPGAIEKQIGQIGSGGGTDTRPGLLRAVQLLADQNMADTAVRHIVLVTDGEDGTTIQDHQKMLTKMSVNGITLSTVGIGFGANGGLLSQLAAYGGGAYHQVDDPTQLTQVFIKEAQTIRKNLIKEVSFSPIVEATNSPITSGMDLVPPLDGLVLTGPREDPSVQMPMVDPEGNPVFAHWQVGLGRTAAFTSDATTRWGAQWVSWPGYGDFWSRTLRYVARPSESQGHDLQAHMEGDELVIRLDTAGSNEANHLLKVQGTVLDPTDQGQPIELTNIGPGLYETRLPAKQAGHYLVSLNMLTPSGQRRRVFTGATQQPGRELSALASNSVQLQQMANTAQGRVFELTDDWANQPPALFAREGQVPTRSMQPVWPTLLPWLLGLFVLDIACRRIAWRGSDWSAAFKQSKQALQQAGQSLAAAKPAVAKPAAKPAVAAAGVATANTATSSSNVGAVAGAPNRATTAERAKQTFQATDQDRAAETSQSPKAQPPANEPSEEDATPASTSRLLAAKRRAQERFES